MPVADYEDIMRSMPVLAHDDALVLRAQKHKAGLERNWWENMHPTGKITGWWNGKKGDGAEHHGADWIPPEDEQERWVAMQERTRALSGGVRLVGYDSLLECRMSLWDDFRRRYRLSLEALMNATDGGVLKYAGAGETPRHRQEAIRNRLKRWWRVVAYEHDILLRGETGAMLLQELKEDDTIPAERKFDDTVYLKGDGSHSSMLVKVYRLTKHGLPDVVKLEVTFRKDYLKRHDMRQPELWETQPAVQANITGALKREWRLALQHAPRTRKVLARELGTTQAELYDAMAKPDNTLTVVLKMLKRLEDLEAKVESRTAEHERRIQALEQEAVKLRRSAAVHREREW